MRTRSYARMSTHMLAGLAFLMAATTGCSLSEAIVDGFLDGISDTVAAVITNVAADVVPGVAP